MRIYKNHKILIFELIFFACVGAGISLGGNKVLAYDSTAQISNVAPLPDSANVDGGGSVQPWFAIGEGDFDGHLSYAKIYVPKNTAATLIVENGDGICPADLVGGSSAPRAQYTINEMDPTEQVGETPSWGATKYSYNTTTQVPHACGDITFTIPKNAGTISDIAGHTNYYVYYFTARYHHTSAYDGGDYEKGFRLRVTNNGSLVGMSRYVGTEANHWFGLVSRESNPNTWDFAVQMAPMCIPEEGLQGKAIKVHDIDWGVYPQSTYPIVNGNKYKDDSQDLTGLIDQDNDVAGTGYHWALTDPPGETRNGTHSTTAASKIVGSEWPYGNHTDDQLTFSAARGERYLLVFKHFGWQNAVQIELPYDQFDSQPSVRHLKDCNPSPPNPNISCTAVPVDATPAEGASTTINVSVKSSVAVNGMTLHETSDPLTASDVQNLRSGQTTYGFGVSNPDPRGSPLIYYTYTIIDNSGNEQASCEAYVTWQVPPPNKPYFKVKGGDVFTGGWFSDTNDDSYCLDNYQAPSFDDLASSFQKGGIFAFAGGGKGASSQYAAYSTGLIDGADGAALYGFYTQLASKSNLSFANSSNNLNSADWGGYFEGTTQQQHCVDDYFNTKQNSPTAGSINWGQSGQYKVNGTTIGGVTIGAGENITVFVDGDLYINNNITYPGASSYTDGNVPKFALVVMGNIYIAPNVNRLDGLYIAQPNLSNIDNTGVIWTCNDGSGSNYNFRTVNANCKTPLTFNGAVIAKQMNLWRVNDGLNSANPDNPAEIFNYTPEMVIGNAFFGLTSSSTNAGYTVESVTSLPPVY